MSNLVANEMYSKDGSKENAVSSIIKGIEALKSSSLNLVIVTNEVFSDGVEYSKETEEYIKNLGNINEYLGKIANEVVEVVYSIPIYHKKEGKHVN